ncbi:glycosyl hydrolase family 18 protein [Clostridium sp. C2-6-12]|uniref:glycosyl hydrolase family 18 protein n=1 Tax=Clostridium sp. C2-6-12 TaxID=2698832 RepID=UPI001370F262|nr:glycosyl hydrolase family 18 protein [Clostridium sp. C2-6-12]
MKTNYITKKQILSVTFFIIIIVISILSVEMFNQIKANSLEVTNSNVKSQDSKEVSVWLPYWDKENSLKELDKISTNINSIENFAAYFNKDNTLFIPDENKAILNEVKNKCKKNNIQMYLSIVNDQVNSDGSSILKDNNLTKNLLKTEESQKNHIDNIVKLAEDGNYDGVEIDYEKINQETLNQFVSFCKSLYERLNEKGIKLRIVLEPKELFGTVQFPKGPEYVMMVYNLYDGSTGPGPKADKNLIDKVAKIMDKIPGKKHLAFSTGGYDWSSGQKTISLTGSDAAKLLEKYKAKPQRDENSGALYFKYYDDKKVQHTVWYSDAETFKIWTETGNKNGYYNISIWRLGGNDEEFIKYINSI